MKRTAVIMAGGSGERFWPLSRMKKPKQLLNLNSDSMTMIEESIDRISPLIPPEDIFIITGPVLLEPMRNALPMLPPENIVAEPAKRNTAPCLALAAAYISARYEGKGISAEEISMAVLTADQRIMPKEAFIRTVESALSYVENTPSLGTIGIMPARPETGYGYIEVESSFDPSNTGIQIKPVLAFREKPDIAAAMKFISSGNHLWNSGMFFWRVDRFIAGMAACLPEVGGRIADMQAALAGQTGTPLNDLPWKVAEIFSAFPSISIDYGLMERADNVVVARALFTWDDIGSWDSLERVNGKDKNDNIITGDVSLVDVSNSIIVNSSSDKKIIVAAIGLSDMVIVTTDDAVLICPKGRVQEVKKCVEQIRESGGNKWL